jgi:4'-phosphopantetheinyl transferase EntD
VIGSLTHTDQFCAVVVTRAPGYRALGIDAEAEQRLDPPLFERVLTARELEGLAQLSEGERRRIATLLFSAKEAFYKCQFPLTGKFLGFHDVELSLDRTRRRFEVKVLASLEALPPTRDFDGRFDFHEGHVVTAVACRTHF